MPNDKDFFDGLRSAWNVVRDVSEWGMQTASETTRGIYHTVTDKPLYERIGNHDSSLDAFNVLKAATPAELQTFYCALYNSKRPPLKPDPESMMVEFATVGGHSIAAVFRGFVGVSYGEIVYDIYEALSKNKEIQLRQIPGYSLASLERNKLQLYRQMEEAIVESLFKCIIDKMTPEQRRKMEEELEKVANQYGESYKAIGGLGAAWILSGMAGFMPYLIASTVVGTITGALGVTLPFAFYTTMSSTLSILLGPVGGLIFGGLLAYYVGSPNLEKTIKCVPIIYCIRKRLERDLSSFKPGDRLCPACNGRRSIGSTRCFKCNDTTPYEKCKPCQG